MPTNKTFEDRMQSSLWRTWECIACDIFKCAEIDTLEQEDVMYAAMDYVEMYGNLSKEDLVQWRKLRLPAMDAIAKVAFPYSYYT